MTDNPYAPPSSALIREDAGEAQLPTTRTSIDLGEARLISGSAAVDETTEPEGLVMEIVRRDPDGEPDFFVSLTLARDTRLPDPRSRLLQVDQDDPRDLGTVAW